MPGLVPTRTTASRAGVITWLATGSRPVSTPLTLDTANVTSWVPGVPGSWTTSRSMFMSGSSIRRLRRNQRHPLGDLLDAVTGHLDVHAVDHRRRRAGSDLVTLQQRRPDAGQQLPDPGRGQVHVAHRTAVVEFDRLGADDRQGHAGQRDTAASRRRGRSRIRHRELGQRLVDRGRRRPHLLGCSGRPARSAAVGCAAARCSRRCGLARRQRDRGRHAR